MLLLIYLLCFKLTLSESIAIPAYNGWTELVREDSTIRLDLRYATDSNFVKLQLYDCPRCFLRPEAAEALLAAQRKLQKQGFGFKLFDCYRPLSVQWKLWEKLPDERYVSHPKKGSMHNRGMAVDLTLVDANGRELDMGTPFDYFGKEAYHAYQELSPQVLKNRKLMLETMESAGFRPIKTEWWHYSFKGKTYPVANFVWQCP